jgi:hypothetical protein
MMKFVFPLVSCLVTCWVRGIDVLLVDADKHITNTNDAATDIARDAVPHAPSADSRYRGMLMAAV